VWSEAIHPIADTDRGTFNHATKTLLARGFIERCYYTGEDKRKVGGYRVTRAGREALASGWSGKSGSRGRMRTARGVAAKTWSALRMSATASLDDLEMLVGAGGEKALRSSIEKYVRALEKAGYLERQSSGAPRWFLVRNTGRQTPLWRSRHAQVFDPNTGDTIDLRGRP
jgi:DNA-binding MarR family transcriptional regulator